VLVEGTPLYLVEADQQPSAIARAVQLLADGRARRLLADTPLPQLVLERVVLAGGGPVDAVNQALLAQGFAAQVADEPRFIAEAGGRALLAGLCEVERGLVVDVGQTSIKVSTADARACLARPLDVPLELHARDPRLQARYRANTVAFFASALRAPVPPAGVVLALPCEVADDLSVAGCSYPWLAGDRTLVSDVLQAAQLVDTRCLVLNDAELAALSIAQQPNVRRTLVLTLGLGLGGAYLT